MSKKTTLEFKHTLKFLAYIPLFLMFCVIGPIYKLNKWLLYQVSDFAE